MNGCVRIGLILMMAVTARARLWTDTQGQTIDADVVWVNEQRTVKLQTPAGEIRIGPFSAFVSADIAYLDSLLSQKGRGKLHAIPWQEMNSFFGLNIWQDDFLWDDTTRAVAERVQLRKESETEFMDNYRAYPLGRAKMLTQPVFSMALYGCESCAENASFVFLNLGDIPNESGDHSSAEWEQFSEQIDASGLALLELLSDRLGQAKRDSIGRKNMREKVWRWDWNEHAILLAMQEGKYSIVRIMPISMADRGGRTEKMTGNELKERMAACVHRQENGDVVIKNIPMVDQGPKGYCSPATWERYLRYINIPADMYQLALVAHTGTGGGTYAADIIEATENLLASYGCKIKEVGDTVEMDTVVEYIDKGLPIMWHFISTPPFQLAANNNTARRNGQPEQPSVNQDGFDTNSGAHVCLIIGYNNQTGEIAISDSWGARFALRWVRLGDINSLSYCQMNIIKW